MIDFCAETPVLGAFLMLGDLDYCVDVLFLRDSLSDSLIYATNCNYSTCSFTMGVIETAGICGVYIFFFLSLSFSRRCFLDMTSE